MGESPESARMTHAERMQRLTSPRWPVVLSPSDWDALVRWAWAQAYRDMLREAWRAEHATIEI